MTNIEQSNAPAPNGADPINEIQSTIEKKFAGGTQSPQKRGPGQSEDDDMKHKRGGGGDVERDVPEDDEHRKSGVEPDMDEDETGGRSRPAPGRSRNT